MYFWKFIYVKISQKYKLYIKNSSYNMWVYVKYIFRFKTWVTIQHFYSLLKYKFSFWEIRIFHLSIIQVLLKNINYKLTSGN